MVIVLTFCKEGNVGRQAASLKRNSPLTMTSLIQRIPPHALALALFAVLIAFALIAFNNPM
jgi:hypothetical protein